MDERPTIAHLLEPFVDEEGRLTYEAKEELQKMVNLLWTRIDDLEKRLDEKDESG